MNRLGKWLGGIAAVTLASAASATITINIHDPGAIQPTENVLLGTANTSTFNAGSGFNELTATTNMGSDVLFQGDEVLESGAGGQANLSGSDGNVTFLQIAPVAPDDGFQSIEFLLSPVTGKGPPDPFTASVYFYDQYGTEFSATNVAFVNGANWFSAEASADEYITLAKIVLTSGVAADIRQVRISGVGVVPEPASWAMLISGFGLIGGSLRSRRRRPALA